MIAPRESHAEARGYLPIKDYALIGDCHGSALVGRDGSIDWCCLGRFDADPVCCRILDLSRGGFLSLAPPATVSVARSYVRDTNILETKFKTERGDLIVTDFMPVGRQSGSGTHNYVDLVAPKWLVRTVEIAGDDLDVRIQFRPSIAFGRERPNLRIEENVISAEHGPFLTHNVPGFALIDDVAQSTVRMHRGHRLFMVLSAERIRAPDAFARIEEYRNTTTAFWREWIAYCRYRGPHAEHVRRSLLAIKLLTYAPSGALVAAPTTSLPEEIGGCRNWDYRYCWLRDTALALYALAITGYGGEARRFSEYLMRICAATEPKLQVVFGVGGETNLEEVTLDHLEGYKGSRPVRVGNGAARQRQIDIYGEILDWALLFQTLGGRLDVQLCKLVKALADHVAAHWREPDQGLWEMRGAPLHHVHGRIMSWVALDRAIRLMGPSAKWARERDRIVSEVNARGGAQERGHLVQAYERGTVDAALLLIPMTAFPIDQGLLKDTIRAIEDALRAGDFMFRYRADDGVAGGEGAFLICSFWLVDAYLCTRRHAEARELFARLLGLANDVGLYAEEIDPADGAFLGNFPQAYTQLALIGSAAHLQLCERFGPAALQGSYADRAARLVSATLGWRAIWAAFKATWRVGRILPSRASILKLER